MATLKTLQAIVSKVLLQRVRATPGDAERPLTPWLAAALLALLLLDIAHRRGLLDPRLARLRAGSARAREHVAARLLPSGPRTPASAAGATLPAEPLAEPQASEPSPAAVAPVTPAPQAEDPLVLAKRRARRR